jgi:large subunit ribosomal protein L4
MRALALKGALTDRAREGKVIVLDELRFETPKTKDAIAALDAMGATKGTVLLVLNARDESVSKSFRNVQRVHVLTVDQINTYDIVCRDWLVFTREAIETLNARAESEPKKAGEAQS